jgi:RNA polymerase sigma-70 factor (ECF subfamily)
MTVLAAPDDMTVDEYALAASMGDRDALGHLYEQLADPLLRWLERKTTNNRHVAEDIAQTTWAKVAGKIGEFSVDAKGNGFEAWLWTIARRTLIDFYRLPRREKELLSGEMLAFDHLETAEGADADLMRRTLPHRIAAEVNSLPKAQREVVLLRWREGLSCEATALIVKRTPNNVSQLLYRAARTLRKRLGDDPELAMAVESSTLVAAPKTNGKEVSR